MVNLVLEYIWIGGKGEIRHKTKVLYNYNNSVDIKNIPKWNYDGSSTWQADSNKNTEITLHPCALFKDPLRNIEFFDCYLILCDTYDDSGNPIETNTRIIAKEIFDKNKEEEPWFGLEQEYFISNKNKIKNNSNDYSPDILNKGLHYCGYINSKEEIIITEEHLQACLQAGITISGINAEVVVGQWEYQIGPCCGIDAGDQFIIAKYLIIKIAEKYNYNIIFHPKPYMHENGSGCHINFSTASTREKGGINKIYNCIEKLSKKHDEHLLVYGAENNERLTGIHETSSYDKFSWGVGTRNTSVRIPNQMVNDGCGYFEDRRPASNVDPYLSTSILFKTCILDD
jgi:glutamine synthetase